MSALPVYEIFAVRYAKQDQRDEGHMFLDLAPTIHAPGSVLPEIRSLLQSTPDLRLHANNHPSAERTTGWHRDVHLGKANDR